jgi:hypothetical protein
MFPGQVGHHSCKLGSRALQRLVILKATDDVDRSIVPVGPPLRIGAERHEDVRVLE